MSAPSSNTEPVTQPSSESSCMRLRQRRKVVLPQPDGPITAVTVCAGNRIDTSLTTARRPYRAVSRTASSCNRASAGGAMVLPDGRASGEGEHEHEDHEHQGRRPRLAVPFLEWPSRVHEDLERQGLHRLEHLGGEVQVAQRREKERRGLARDPGHADGATPDDPPGRPARYAPAPTAPAPVA